MKLIIDIPESMYEGVMIDRVLDTTVIRILNEIKNGTPLDNLRAEIEEYKNRTVFSIGTKDLETGKQIALDNVLGIIDKI